jgi:hypothetical protein
MPENKFLNSAYYVNIINNPDIKEFLNDCEFFNELNDDQLKEISTYFMQINSKSNSLPENIISIDSDYHQSNINSNLPYTNIGYVKVACNLLKKTEYAKMCGNNFVDPFKMTQITKNSEEIIAVLPCSNMSYKHQKTTRDGFRLALEEFFEKTLTEKNDSNFSLKQTLFWLSSFRNDNNENKIILHKCPSCGHDTIEVLNIEERQKCPYCNNYIYSTDCLRIYEAVEEDTFSNVSSLGRLKVAIKHIYLAHMIRIIMYYNKDTYLTFFSNMAFLINGTLSISGQPAWIHRSMMKIINFINNELRKIGKNDILIIGMVNSSSNVAPFSQMISNSIIKNSIYCISDDFREKYIDINKDPSQTTFGFETYYGQDFIYKSNHNKMFVFNLPYPFYSKDNKEEFKILKSELEKYNNLNTTLDIINTFECEMDDNKIVPIILSEKYTVLNNEPGASVIDLLTRKLL